MTSYRKNNWETWDLNLGGGNILTGIIVQDVGKNSADNIAGVYYRSVQYLLNGAWVTAASI
ncbi:TPA: phage tail protein [Citrobacter rodentium]|nr:phage tail protein [Citrobacter rodentium NBRC 105723 = DSM 16636]HAT8020765.1 phage tail protein [Citrobacter rodentium]HAT8030632.1 phage tail protein [Citrobacter rodentium]HAT8035459.1 phage tail protein [Citrobacter rodentium]HAT8040180.1 phage tail protein [Citrobacter rodentium]